MILDRLINAVDEIVDNAAQFHINEAHGLLLNRVFEENKNVNGENFGKYRSEAYKKYREKLGRQVNKVDLQLQGNLLKSIVTSKIDDSYAIVFSSDEQQIIGRFQDERYGETFAISDQEREELMKKTSDYIHELNSTIFSKT